MTPYPDIDPVAVSLGPVSVHWYGLCYLAAFAMAWWLGRRDAARHGILSEEQVGDLIVWGAMGVILGGRLGYVLFYGFERFLGEPLWALKIWSGGMSFHGGLIGVVVAMWLFARKVGRPYFAVQDFVAPIVPLGLGFGRIGNFINGELPGRATDVSWALVWPGDSVARHPSSLYQAFTEGLVLFAVVFLFTRVRRPLMAPSGLFLLTYGLLRFCTEFFRQPDAHLGFLALGLSMGQWLSVPMVLGGAALLALAYRQQTYPEPLPADLPADSKRGA